MCWVVCLSRRLQVIPFSAVLQCSSSAAYLLYLCLYVAAICTFSNDASAAYYKQQWPVFVFACHWLSLHCGVFVWIVFALYLYLHLNCKPLQTMCHPYYKLGWPAHRLVWTLQPFFSYAVWNTFRLRHNIFPQNLFQVAQNHLMKQALWVVIYQDVEFIGVWTWYSSNR